MSSKVTSEVLPTTPVDTRGGYECAGTSLCGRLCKGLGRAGLSTNMAPNMGVSGECEVPSLLKRTPNGMHVDGLDGELPDKLATRLADYLSEYAEKAGERERIGEVKQLYQAVHDARDTLYRQVLSASRDGGLAPEEMAYYQDQVAMAQKALETGAKSIDIMAVFMGRAAYDHECMEKTGIILTDSMVQAVEKMIGNVSMGKPALLTGDKGIAKTSAVKYISRLIAPDKEPIIISGHGDMMAHELMGKQGQNKETGQIEHQDGRIIQAAREGRPVLVDEVNVADQSVMMRLQDVLLLKPGDSFDLQENGQEQVVIQPGFAIFMTANEGDRYLGRRELDTAFRDRMDIITFGYPDPSKKPLNDDMSETLRLAFAAAVDSDGRLSDHVEIVDLMYLARLSHVSQQLYAQPATNVNLEGKNIAGMNQGAVTGLLDAEPVMSDCITPRTMIDVITRAARGNLPGVTLPAMTEKALRALDANGGSANRKIVTRLVAKHKKEGK